MIPDEQDISSLIENGRNPDSEILADIVEGYDAESTPDIFNYTLPNGGSGKFVFKRSEVLSEFLRPVVLPFKPVKIVPNLSGENLDYFEIKDENGVLYRFGKSISTGHDVHEKYYDYNDLLNNGVTSWLLTEIISSDKSDTVYFEYDNVLNPSGETGIFRSQHTFARTVSVEQTVQGIVATNDTGPVKVFSSHVYTQKKITKIRFKSGTVNFIYKSNTYPNHLLDKIEIYANESSSPLKTIKFSQTKYHTSSELLNWHKLDALSFYDSDNIRVNKYDFLYDASSFPQIHYSETTYSVDFWGYYNGKPNVFEEGQYIGLLPDFDWTCPFPDGPNPFGSANRDPDYQFAKAGVLTKITNPTGGETIFEYEGNRTHSNDPVGGIRIKSITHRTNEKDIKRSFEYWGISKPVVPDYFVRHSTNSPETTPQSITDSFTASSEPHCDIFINGRSVLYTKVIEFIGEETSNNGRIEHLFDDSFIVSTLFPNLKLSSEYPWFVNGEKFSYGPLPEFYNSIVLGNIFEKETKVLDALGNPVRTTKNYYSHDLKQALKGFKVSRIVDIPEAQMFLYDRTHFYHFYNYDIDQLSQKLDSTVVTHYSTGSSLTTRERYSYNDNLFVTEKKSQKSNGSWLISKYKYPNDFVAQAPYDDMVNNRNIISPVVEQSNYEETAPNEETTPLQFIKTNYRNWGNNIIAPESVEFKTGTNPYETRIRYHSYDNEGNVESVSKDGGPKISYIWGYNKSYPIAEAVNANTNDIAYTSFEADGKGHWSYNGLVSNNAAYALTGTHYYTISAGMTKNGLNSEKTYIVSYWKKGGTPTVSGGNVEPGVIGRTHNGWTYVSHEVSGTTSITINGSGHIDQVQLYPIDAQMTTYTYDPLIGITSQTDVNNITTYYEYDAFHRLKIIKDNQGKITTNYKYHYVGQSHP